MKSPRANIKDLAIYIPFSFSTILSTSVNSVLIAYTIYKLLS
jgi:hypothetical protein